MYTFQPTERADHAEQGPKTRQLELAPRPFQFKDDSSVLADQSVQENQLFFCPSVAITRKRCTTEVQGEREATLTIREGTGIYSLPSQSLTDLFSAEASGTAKAEIAAAKPNNRARLHIVGQAM